MNCFLPAKKKQWSGWAFLLSLLLFFAFLGIFVWGLRSVSQTAEGEQLKSLEEAITRSAVQCYALEGAYPQNLQYLEENYGVLIDHNKYAVDYQCFASNIMPDIVVMLKNAPGYRPGESEAAQ